MSEPLRIAREVDLPPGAGVVVHLPLGALGERAVSVYNDEGRYFAEVLRRDEQQAPYDPPGPLAHGCCGGHHASPRYAATGEDAPPRLHTERAHACTVEDGWIVLRLA